ncbi:hypothetical protein B0H11DRAFT_1940513 [Mycena galericulata]|nr:hypothetical protein B0H11DRAFT_1940513 [Mycena galericulata]
MDLLGPLDSSSLQSPLSPETHKRAAQDSEDSASPWRIDNDGRNKVQIRSAFRGEAKQRIDSLDEENYELKAQLAGYQTEKEGLEASVISAQRAIVEWKEHVKMLQDKLSRHDHEGTSEARILSLDEENLSLKAQLAGYQTEKEGLEASVTSAQRAIVEWKEHVKMLQDKLPKHDREGTSEARIQSLDEENLSLKAQLASYQTEKEGLEARVTSAQRTITEWKEQVETLKDELSKVGEPAVSTTAKAHRKRAYILFLDEENLSLKAQLASFQTEKEGLEASVTSAQRAIVEWKEHVKMLQDKLPKHDRESTSEARIQSLDEENLSLKAQLASYQTEKEGLEASVTSAQRTITEWKEHVETLKDELSKHDHDGTSEARILFLDEENISLKAQLTSYQTEKEGLEASVTSAQRTITEWKEQVETLQDELYKVGEPAVSTTAKAHRKRAYIQSLDEENHALKVQLAGYQTEKEGLEARVNTYKRKDDLKVQIAGLETDRSRLAKLYEEQTKDLESSINEFPDLSHAKLIVDQSEEDEGRHLDQINNLLDHAKEVEEHLATLEEEKSRIDATLAQDTRDIVQHRALTKTLISDKTELQKVLQIRSLEALNSELEEARENAEDELQRKVEVEVQTRIEGLRVKMRKEWETEFRGEITEQDSMFARKVEEEVKRKLLLQPVIQLAQKELQHATQVAEKRRQEMETQFAESTKEMERFKSSTDEKIRKYEQERTWLFQYVAAKNVEPAASTREGGPNADVDMPYVNLPPQPGGSSSTGIQPQSRGGSPGAKLTPPRGDQGSSSLPYLPPKPNSTPSKDPFSGQQSGQPASTPRPNAQSGGPSMPEFPNAGPRFERDQKGKWKATGKPIATSTRAPKKARGAEEAMAMGKFRHLVQKSLGIKSDNEIMKLWDGRATPEALQAFEAGSLQPEPEPETRIYPFDMSGENVVHSLWNQAIGEQLITEFLKTYEAVVDDDDNDDDREVVVGEQFLRTCWTERMKCIRKRQLEAARAVIEPGYMEEHAELARRLTHRSALYIRRLRSSQLIRDAEVRKLFAVFLQLLSGQVMSSDEEIGSQRRRKTCRVIRKDWRATLMINLLKWLDYHADAMKLTASGVASGSSPHSRVRSPIDRDTKQSSSPYIKGLPCNLYDPVWLSGLDKAAKAVLNVQKEIELPKGVLSWPNNEDFEADANDKDEYWRPPTKET